MMLKLFVLAASIAVVSGGHSHCHFFNSREACLDGTEGGKPCEWCHSQAVPSKCYDATEASKLPTGVFQCEHKQTVDENESTCHDLPSKDQCVAHAKKDGCMWCASAAVPSSCLTKQEAAKLPKGAFECTDEVFTFEQDEWELYEMPSRIDLMNSFERWARLYGKQYESEFHEMVRFNIFMENAELVVKHNQNSDRSYTLALNEFADISWNEFQEFYLGAKTNPQECSATHKGRLEVKEADVPEKQDWREKGIVSEVKNQGHCGSCWTFSTTGCLESHHMKKFNKMVLFSEQNLIDCADAFDNHGCNGGLPSHAFEYVRFNGGLDTERSYPYHAKKEPCKFNAQSSSVQVQDVMNITSMSEVELKKAVGTVGPVSIAFEVVDDFRFYKHGVYDSKDCKDGEKDVNHAVLAVGYGHCEKEGKDFWIVKNSWGTEWGDKGYFKIFRGANRCGVADCASYPIL